MKSKPVEHHPGALLDIEESAVWYEERQPGLGDRFHSAVQFAEHTVQQHPLRGAPGRWNTRRLRLKIFPHSLVYREELHRIVIVAVAHAKRQEDYWQDRLD
jgi:toxin ParE1/3/4